MKWTVEAARMGEIKMHNIIWLENLQGRHSRRRDGT